MRIFWTLGACCLAAGAVAGPDGLDMVTRTRFPDADAVTVEEREKVVYRPDGTSRTESESWTKVLTEKGRREERVLTLDYSARYGKAAIVSVGIVGTDGRERAVDVGATQRDATDNSAMGSNIYDPMDRKITCTVPDLGIGETLHVKTTRETVRSRIKDQWSDICVMEWARPILKSVYEVTAPKERPIRKKMVRNPLGNISESERTLADGSVIHTFVATNSPQAFFEPDMPPVWTQMQNVRLSTAESWPEISRWYWDLCAPHLAKTNAAMAAKVKELGGDMRRIFKFVSQEVRYMGLTLEDTSPGYAPHDVDITFDNRYGVCRDKAGLLVAMLRLAGHKAFPVLINVGAKMDREVPQPYFNHAIVAVEESGNRTNGQYLLMDPTNENTKDLFPSYLCNSSYLVARPEGEDLRTSPVPPPADNALDIVSSAALSRDGSMFYETEIALNGINDTAYRGTLAKRTPEERTKTFERILRSSVAGAELVRCEILPKDLRDTSVPMTVRLVARFPGMVIRGETRDELSVPMLSQTLGIVNFLLAGDTSLEKRKYTLKLDTTAQVRERLAVDLGGALGEVVELPRSERTCGGYDYARVFAVTNGTLTMDRSLTLSAVEFSPERYQALREEIKRVEAAERKKPVFASDWLHDANVRRILDSSETTLFSDTSWVTTNIDVTEVLTYKGKKDSAELKFNYHPSWKRIEIIEATVSNRNGKVSSVTPKEVNEMDCGWASAAPRYPAGKIKIVNLPSVEIGSVITVKTVVTVTNAPAPFYTCLYFDSYGPVNRLVRRVDGFCRDVTRVKRLADEPSQPAGVLWRSHEIITRGDWQKAAERLMPAVENLKCDFGRELDRAAGLRIAKGRDAAAPKASPAERIEFIRNWMAKNVRVVGPALYDLPLDLQLADPEVVLKERYATRLDYVRTLCALLRGAGYRADVVFGTINEDDPEAIRQLDKVAKPNVRAFASALCRVREKQGGFLGFGGTETTYYLGTENEYTPLGATVYAGSDCFDPARAAFETVTVPGEADGDSSLRPRECERNEIFVRENGSVDVVVRSREWGPSVGGFRKKFAEILPENRSRLYQSLLGGIAQAASATSELETDVTGYPAEMYFSCYIPDYATASGDTLSIRVPAFDATLPNLTGAKRMTPFAVGATEEKVEEIVIRFPPGYTQVEHVPSPYIFASPADAGKVWQRSEVETSVTGDVLSVTLRRTTAKRPVAWFDGVYAELIRDWRRIADSRVGQTITVRRASAFVGR